MKTIMIIEDDINILNLVSSYLENEGYSVIKSSTGKDIESFFVNNQIDLLITDIMLGEINGLEITKKIHSNYNIPIIIISARGDELDRIIGIELGADDYLAKPFSPRELVVRVKALFRRIEKNDLSNSLLIYGDLSINTELRQIMKDGSEIEMTKKEFDLLVFMITNKNKVITRELLLESIWKNDYEVYERTVDELIKRLRKKLITYNSKVIITAVRGVGFRIEEKN